MKTRFPNPTLEPFGLFAIIESERVILPLKGVECDFTVLSGMAEVSMTQIFRQENKQALDCEYVFPLPADAAVFSCEADINGRIIRAQVHERTEARKLAAEKKADGFRTAMMELERGNLFTLSLGNLQPDDLVIMQLKYFQPLRHSLAGGATVTESQRTCSIEIPFCPGIRYIPGKALLRNNRGKGVIDDTDEVPDASRIRPVRIDAEHPDAAYIEIRGTLDGRFVAESNLRSPSHPITVRRTEEQLRITLTDKADVPDRDFVLRWNECETQAVASRVWIRQKGAEAYALLEIRAPKQSLTERAPVDFYFLVDRSGSMQGEKWAKATEALLSCLRVLGPADRAMITFFESRHQDFAERPLPIGELLADRQLQTIEKIGTAGGTEMRPALQHVLEVAAKHSRGRDKNLILITDAQIGNESAILGLLKPASDLPVHCFGIDVVLNDSLLLAVCRQQGGTFHSLNPNDDIPQAVTTLGQTLGQPVLIDLKLADGWELADNRIPNLYAGQVHYLSARSTTPKPMELTARTPLSESVTIQFEQQPCSSESPYLHWCRSRMQRLIAEGNENQAVALSVQSNLICTLTAFFAWDESEKVAVAVHELFQPSQAVAGGMAAACAMHAPVAAPMAFAKQSRGGGWFSRFVGGGDDVTDLPCIRESDPLDELAFKRQLSDICHRIGVPGWQASLKAILDWIAQARDAERRRRIESAHQLLEQIKSSSSRFESMRASREDIVQEIHQLLKSFVESFSKK
ncbi:MAG TPA: VIT domain-containing protein [Verrucomicrobiae bacterium]|nr:VIT domain-containing protein [Verrucomicrobiae bacterium]